MLRTSLTAIAIAVLGSHSFPVAQTKPDFSGTWTAVPGSSGTSPAERPNPPAFGQQFTIDHRGQSLTLHRAFAAGLATIEYTLDGTETTSRMPGRLCEPDTGAVWSASWNGETVVLTMIGAVPPNGKRIEMDAKSTLTLETADTLRVETAARTAGQNAPQVTSTVYKRASGPDKPALPATQRTEGTIAQVSWLSGTWIGSSRTTTFEERWTPSAGGSMIGVSRTIRDGIMSGFEFLCIVEREGGLVYQAMPNGRSPATDFTMTKLDANSVVFENPAHDFPKMIRYTRRPDGMLEAVVSGAEGSKPLSFVFEKKQ